MFTRQIINIKKNSKAFFQEKQKDSYEKLQGFFKPSTFSPQSVNKATHFNKSS